MGEKKNRKKKRKETRKKRKKENLANDLVSVLNVNVGIAILHHLHLYILEASSFKLVRSLLRVSSGDFLPHNLKYVKVDRSYIIKKIFNV